MNTNYITPSQTALRSRWTCWLTSALAWMAIIMAITPSSAQAQSAGTGIITGRVLNAATGDYLRNAVITVVGSNNSIVAEAGGNFRLLNVPAGEVRIKAEYASLDTVEVVLSVTAGQTLTHDFILTSDVYGKDTVILDKFVVASEREGNAKAIQEQRNAVNMKTVIAADAFGDVSEGNVGEFMKRMPGVAIDYTEADARQIRIRGMNPKYAVVLMDGAPVASSGSSDITVGRAFELEQLSISSIETIELSKTPTPDQQASAVAGVVNLRSKGAFDSKGRRISFQASAALNGYDMLRNTPGPDDAKTRKIQPNFSVNYADVLVSGKIGIQAGVNYSRTFAEQKAETVGYRWDTDPTNNLTEVPIVTGFSFRDSPKVSTRINYNTRLDFKLSANAWFYTRLDYNTYEARFYSRDLSVNVAGTSANQGTINSPTGAVDASVPYSYSSQTSQTVATQAAGTYVNTNINQGGGATNKHGATVTWTNYGEYTHGALSANAQIQYSRATNWYSDLPYGFFWAAGTSSLTGQQLRFDRNGPEDMAVRFTQVAGASDWTNLSNYRLTTLLSNDRASDDEKYSTQFNFKYPVELKIPIMLKWGAAVNEAPRNVYRRKNNASYTFVGPDHIANTADDNAAPYGEPSYRMKFDKGGSADSNLINLDRFGLARAYSDHPDWFTGPTDATLLQTVLQNHWNLAEQINAAYFQSIFKLGKFTIAPGARYEYTRTKGKGPNDIGARATLTILTGSPTGVFPATDPQYIITRYGGKGVAGTKYGDLFKYLHATYQLNPSLLFRASYHDSITRPDLANLFQGYSVTSDTATPPTANANNPNLKPEYARSVNLDAEYYFGKTGSSYITLGVFRTDIRDMQRRRNIDVDANGVVGDTGLVYPELAGYRLSIWDNIAKSHNTGFELNYNQSLSFLPGPLAGTSFFFNATHLIYDVWDNYLTSSKDIDNAGLSYRYKKYSARFAVNRTGYHRDTTPPAAGAANAGIASFTRERTMCDMSVGYELTRNLSIFANGRNIFNEPLNIYSLGSQIITRQAVYGALWTIGVSGKY